MTIKATLARAVAAPFQVAGFLVVLGFMGLIGVVLGLGDWLELHAVYGGDRAAQERGRWRNQ